MVWKPGETGNPGGRPKGMREVQEAARLHTKLAIDTLSEIARDKEQSGRARVAAAEVLLDRVWGRAPQTIEVQGFDKLPDHAIDAILSALDSLDANAAGPPRGANGSAGVAGKTVN